MLAILRKLFSAYAVNYESAEVWVGLLWFKDVGISPFLNAVHRLLNDAGSKLD